MFFTDSHNHQTPSRASSEAHHQSPVPHQVHSPAAAEHEFDNHEATEDHQLHHHHHEVQEEYHDVTSPDVEHTAHVRIHFMFVIG